MLKALIPIQHPYTTLFRRIHMQIENLSKELSTEEQKDVKGGIAFTSQNVPTTLQSNELIQAFHIASNGPVAIANDATQDNDWKRTPSRRSDRWWVVWASSSSNTVQQ